MDYTIETMDGYIRGHFKAMASPCEVLLDTLDQQLAQTLIKIVATETRRIEHKYSRYRDNNVIHRINHCTGKPITVDEESARLLDYAQQCYELSDGLFDISSGVLRQAWHFDGSDRIPNKEQINTCLEKVGWDKLEWNNPTLRLAQGMEIDLGGIGKEYAVDRCAQLIQKKSSVSSLLNFGGDIVATNTRSNGSGWNVGLEHPDSAGNPKAVKQIELKQGAIATSGDARRYLLKDGIRYSHILNPKTGWPVTQAPRSVTVISNTCTEAGILATFAMLHGAGAETFLQQQGVQFWCIR